MSARLSGPLRTRSLLRSLALRGFDAGAKCRHQVAHGTRPARRNLLRRLLGGLASAKVEQLLAIFVSVPFGDPAYRHRGDERPGCLDLAIGPREVAWSA